MVLRHIVIHTAIGAGPLFVGKVALEAAAGPANFVWDTQASSFIAAISLAGLGYFFGWSLVALSTNYEEFWRIPGRVVALRRLVIAASADSALVVFASSLGISETTVSRRALRTVGYNTSAIGTAHWAYAVSRGFVAAAALSVLWSIVGLGHASIYGGPVVAWAVALAGFVAATAALTIISIYAASNLAARLAYLLTTGPTVPPVARP